MKILAIETSCDETAVAVIEGPPFANASKGRKGENIKVLSNVISSQVKLHAKYGGVVPSLAAREHTKNIGHVFRAALKQAGISISSRSSKLKANSFPIDLIAVTRGPGLGPALLVGLTFARTLAWHYKKPLVGVNHMDGHIHSNWLKPTSKVRSKNVKFKSENTSTFNIRTSNLFPALNLIVSGGHTELVLMRGHGQYKIIGETLDDAVGEAFDKVARLLGLGYPGGPAISKLAEQGNPDAYPLPRPMAKSKDYNFSYSGLKTAVLYLLRDMKTKKLTKRIKSDVAASFQKAAIEVLVQKTLRAAKEYKVKAILLSGGVSANKLLRHELRIASAEASVKYIEPAMAYTTDNAAMIAVAGYFQSLKNKKTPPFFKKRGTADWKSVKMDANLVLG